MSKILYWLRAVLFMGSFIICAFCLCATLSLALPLRLFSTKLYRQCTHIGQKVFKSLIFLLNYCFTPGFFVFSGEHQWLSGRHGFTAMCNHQIYPDWWYLWILSNWKGFQVKFMLMDIIRFIPLFGWGCWLFEFIFVKRKLEKDKNHILQCLQMSKNTPSCLFIFPEGTLNTPNNRETSRKYAKKMDLKEDPQFVILPKSTGLLLSLVSLKPEIHTLMDITIGYSGLNPEDVPYDKYLMENCFFKGDYPERIHYHVRKYNVNQIPGVKDMMNEKDIERNTEGKDLFHQWLRSRFMEKDALLKTFYETGQFQPSILKNPVSYELYPELNETYTTVTSNHDAIWDKDHRETVRLVPEMINVIAMVILLYFSYYWIFPLYWKLFLFIRWILISY